MKHPTQNKSYVLRVVVEPDDNVWRAYIPELEQKGASAWGHTKEEAIRNIQEVVQMVIEELIEDGQQVPEGITVSENPVVAVTV